jgi:hypothetical protein
MLFSPFELGEATRPVSLQDVLHLNSKLVEETRMLQSEVAMWKGKYDALERT